MSADFTIPVYFNQLRATLGRLSVEQIDAVVSSLLTAYDNGKTIFLFGNGGSAALASHMACDLGKGTASVGNARLRVIALTDNVELITAWANDTSYANIFAEQLANLIMPGDLALAISGSGNSPNILAGLHLARQKGAVTAGISGFAGGKLKALCDVCIVVPSDDMQIIEDAHSSIAHAIFRAVRQEMERRNAPRAMAAVASVDGRRGEA